MINEYLRDLEFQLANSLYVDTLTVLEREVGRVGGHIRLRGMLINGDIFEISDQTFSFRKRKSLIKKKRRGNFSLYIRIVQNNVEVVRYNYHWQDNSNRLIRRWDNARHHLQIRTFPRHVHIGAESNIHESDGMDVERFLKQIEQILL